MPGRFIIAFCIFALLDGASIFADPVSDSEAFDLLLAETIRTGLSDLIPKAGKAVSISFPSGPALSAGARQTAEAAISAAGFSVTDSGRANCCRLSILIGEIGCTLVRHDGGFDRHLSLTVRLVCTDQNSAVVFAKRLEKGYSDRIDEAFLDKTNTGARFSPNLQRKVIRGGPGMLKIASFISLTAALLYFSLQR